MLILWTTYLIQLVLIILDFINMELGKDAHQMRLDLLVNGYVIKFYYEINNNTTVLVAANKLTISDFFNMFNGIVWF